MASGDKSPHVWTYITHDQEFIEKNTENAKRKPVGLLLEWDYGGFAVSGVQVRSAHYRGSA